VAEEVEVGLTIRKTKLSLEEIEVMEKLYNLKEK